MAKRKKNEPPPPQAMPPLIHSLLRLPREAVVARMLAALAGEGFDVTRTEMDVFMYPGPEGRRPIELAQKCAMTRQAMNYVLAGLERRGYLERKAGFGAGARVVSLTERGWGVMAAMRSSVFQIQEEWTAFLGEERFLALAGTLRDLAQWLGKLP